MNLGRTEDLVEMEKIEAAIKKTMGNLVQASKELGIHYYTLYKVTQRNPHLKEMLTEIRKAYIESKLDVAEDAMDVLMTFTEKAPGSSHNASQYILNNLGEKRGYNHPDKINDAEKLKLHDQKMEAEKSHLLTQLENERLKGEIASLKNAIASSSTTTQKQTSSIQSTQTQVQQPQRQSFNPNALSDIQPPRPLEGFERKSVKFDHHN